MFTASRDWNAVSSPNDSTAGIDTGEALGATASEVSKRTLCAIVDKPHYATGLFMAAFGTLLANTFLVDELITHDGMRAQKYI